MLLDYLDTTASAGRQIKANLLDKAANNAIDSHSYLNNPCL
jgi:hypothetical protein